MASANAPLPTWQSEKLSCSAEIQMRCLVFPKNLNEVKYWLTVSVNDHAGIA